MSTSMATLTNNVLGYNSNFFQSTNNMGTLTNNILGNGNNQSSNILSDYNLIKSGSYKKLLSAYYDKIIESETETKDKTDSKEQDTIVKQDTDVAKEYKKDGSVNVLDSARIGNYFDSLI